MKKILIYTALTVLFSLKSFTEINIDEIRKIEHFRPVINELLRDGVDTFFVYNLVTDPRTEFHEKYSRINVTGFLGKPDYSSHYNALSVKKNKTFHAENIQQLQKAEDKFGVPTEVIAAVLWVETRHGGYTGNHHVASVYLSLALTKQDVFVDKNIKNLHEKFDGDASELPALENKVKSRSEKKAEWALSQLKAMSQLALVHPFDVLDIKGSWAGAFGYSQFLPSSYMNWAVDGNEDGKINLFDMDDAIFSVANYLKINGWGDSEEEQRKAVFHYNNSSAYVNAVLKLAELTKEDEDSDRSSSLVPLDNPNAK